ncbi:Ig-like domain-containing protein [Clostridium baratii]|uniref:Ig-like domain-containing protein n=1 Tax=Clostridium baratii TaxID=1561 RepID=UPI0029109ABD|nr:Ig-like domain-containing protein [Clostridium baratii]MDU4911506.1 Ig-like domain-containing protein [Clostridium baratii]
MKCKKILGALLSLSIIVTSSGVTALADIIKEGGKNPVSKVLTEQKERSMLFNDGWTFNLGDVQGAKDKEFNDDSWRKLTLPHDWSIEQDFNKNSPSTHEGGYLDGGIGWYRKTFVLPKSMEGKKISIDFDGVYMDSYVYVNGTQVGNHPYGYTPFSFDITKNLVCDGVTENVISVKVNNKQPSSRWYSGSGIYRDVHLTVTEKVSVDKYGTFVTTPNLEEEYKKGRALVDIKTDILNEESEDKNVKVISTIYDAEGKNVGETSSTELVDKNSERQFSHKVEVKKPKLWSTESGYMYKVVTTVSIDEKVVDEYETDFGMRWFNFSDDNGFFLNGKQMKLQGVCMHHDQGALGAVSNEAAIERQVKILKDMGVNSIRVTHNPASQQLIDICNREGILLIEEAFDTWYDGKKTYDYGRFFEKKSIHGDMTWAEFDIKQMVERGKNAPSIIMWSLGNEIWETNQTKAVQTAKNLNKWVKEVDPTRPTTMGEDKFRMGTGQGTHEAVADIIDVVGFNYAEDNYDSLREKHPKWKIYGSENSSATRSRGVYSHPEQTLQMHTHQDKQQSSYDNDHVGWGKTAEEAWKRDRDRGYISGEYIWTGFDYIGEPTPYYGSYPAKSSYFGAIDTAGFPKDIYYFYQSQWSSKPMVHLLPHWSFENDDSIKVDGDKILVYAYTNANSVDLYYNEDVNSKELGELVATDTYEVTNAGYNGKYKETKEGKLHLEFKVQYKPGKLTAVAKDKNGKEIARDEVKTAKEAKKLNLTADRQVVKANGSDLSYITVDVVDENGTIVPNADNLINFEISGNGKIVGVDNGNAASVERYKDNKRKADHGKALVIVQSDSNEGSFTLTATSEGLSTDNIKVYSVNEEDMDKEEIVGYDVSDIVVPVNGELNLQDKVTALYSNGSKGEVPVTWEEVSSDKLSKAGIFKVTGTTEDSDIPIEVTVIVKDIIGILDSRVLTSVNDKVELPKEVSAIFNDGSIENHPVTWDRELTDEDVNSVKTVEIEGTVEGVSGLKAKLIVTISDKVKMKNIALNEGKDFPKAFTTYEGSDNINNINDGVISKNNSPQNRWTNWGKPGGNYDDYVGIEFSKAYSINKIGLSLYKDHGVEIPSEIIVEYLDGEEWKEVKNQSKKTGFSEEGTEEITFNTVKTSKIRALLKEDTNANKAVGLTEFEVYSNVLVSEGTSLLKEIKVNDKAIENFKEDTKNYAINLPYGSKVPKVTAVAKDNASVFIVPALDVNGTTRIIVIGEDGTNRSTYLIKFKESDPTIESASISLGKENIIEDDIVDIITEAKLQDGNNINKDDLDIKYNVSTKNGAEVQIKDNKLYAYTAGEVSLSAEVTYKGVKKTTNVININIGKNTSEKKIVSYEKVNVDTNKGVKPNLPSKVKANYDVGLSRDVEVKWNDIKEEDYNKYGVFTVEGTVEGQELKPTAKVTVKGISALGNLSIATNKGVAPKLPGIVKAYYTDGTNVDVDVTWADYDKNLLNKEGTFKVEGTVKGTDIKASINVRVSSEAINGDNIALGRNGYDLPMAFASYTNDNKIDSASQDRIEKVNDGVIEHDPNKANNRWSNWKRGDKRTSDWVGVIFGSGVPEMKYINNLEVDFFEDSGTKIPKNYTVEYYVGDEIKLPSNPAHVLDEENSPLNDDNNWKEVTNLTKNPEETSGSATNYLKFDMVKTFALRIKMNATDNMGMGITEIKAYEKKTVLNQDFNTNMIKVNGKDLEGFREDRVDYTLKLKDNEKLPEVTADVTNNASVSVIYTAGQDEKLDVLIKSEDGIKNKTYSLTIERENRTEVNKTALRMAINYAERAEADGALNDVVPAVSKEFKEALKEAKAVYANEDATLEEVDTVFKRLMKAIHMLEFKKGDKEALQGIVDIIDSLEKDNYIESTWTKLEASLKEAKKVLANENAMETEVDNAFENLMKSYLDLRLKPDKLKLEELIKEIKAMDLSKYTKESVENLNKALDNAEKVLKNDAATSEDINNAIKNLTKARNELKENSDDNVNDEDKDEDKNDNSNINKPGDNNSNNGNTSGNNNGGSSSQGQENNSNQGKVPATGGLVSSGILLAGLVSLAGGTAIIRRKRK